MSQDENIVVDEKRKLTEEDKKFFGSMSDFSDNLFEYLKTAIIWEQTRLRYGLDSQEEESLSAQLEMLWYTLSEKETDYASDLHHLTNIWISGDFLKNHHSFKKKEE